MHRFPLALLAFLALLTLALAPRPASAQTLAQSLQSDFDAGALPGLHGVLVLYRGKKLVEIYFDGQDQRWGVPLGNRRHGPNTLHDMRSVTKSVVGLLYGIALDRGLVPPPDAALYAQFPEYADLARDPKRARITIADALTMRMGTAWDETTPYSNPRNSEIAMERAPDRYRFVLEQKILTRPGGRWTYSGGATALVARIIEKGTGKPIDAFAREALFAPLGITRFDWVKGGDGVPSAASGLRLTLPALARIGTLVAGHGRYNGKQIVSARWMKAATSPLARTSFGLQYGYFWWHSPAKSPAKWTAAMGNGGQRLTVQPHVDLVIAIIAGNYNHPKDWKTPVAVIEKHVVPAILNSQ
ncbi:beta-lactamase family protein [Rhodobacteraceae bacterium D3-12]|nr:beta-lactamase family protein [Rhodobacteraceae bacterium D3-12]